MRVRIAFDEAARGENLDRKVIIGGDVSARQREPGLEMRHLVAMAQCSAAEATQSRQEIESKEPTYRAGPDTPAFVDQAIDGGKQSRTALDPAAETRRRQADDFLAARMHIFGDGDGLIGLGQ